MTFNVHPSVHINCENKKLMLKLKTLVLYQATPIVDVTLNFIS